MVFLPCWITVLTCVVIFLTQGSEASRWRTRTIHDFRQPPFREPPPMDHRMDIGPDFGQSFRRHPPFETFNMIQPPSPSYHEFYDPVTGRHHKIFSRFTYNFPPSQPQQYSRSYKLQDASPFPSSYDKKRLRHSFGSPQDNSYANDNQFYSDFATRRRKSLLTNPQYTEPATKGKGFNDNFYFYLLSNWKDYRNI